jgi:putative ABC transport system permease protein
MNWLTRLFARPALDRDLAEEMRQHLDEMVEHLMATGLPRDEAARQARREFGNITLLQERGRDVWRWHLIEDAWADLRYAWRQMRRSPAFALATVATLTAGIAGSTAVFSVVNGVMLRPLPFPEPERLVAVHSRDRRGPDPATLSYPTFFDFRSRSKSFERLSSYRSSDMTLTGHGLPVQLRGQIVSWDFFQTLRVDPVLGRAFRQEEEAREARVVVISHQVWSTFLGGDPGIVGQRVTIDGGPHVVVGVAPAGFSFPIEQLPVQIWTTLARDASSATVTPVTMQRGARMLDTIGRLASGVSAGQALAEVDGIAGAIARDNPDQNKNIDRAFVRPAIDQVVGRSREPLIILWAAVTLLQLIACANVASLLLARAGDREREFGLRLAIGGSRGRLIRQLVTENLLFACAGCVGGIAAAMGALRQALPVVAEMLPRGSEIGVDVRVLAFSTALAVVTALLISVPGALRLARGRFDEALGKGTRGATANRTHSRGVLVVGQIAVSLVLLVGAIVLTTVFVRLARRDLGFEPRQLVTFSAGLPSSRYSVPQQIRFVDDMIDQLRAMPGITSAAAGMPLPLEGSEINISFNIVERPSAPSERPRADMAIVTPGYFATIGTPIVAGRDFTSRDDGTASRVLVVNEAFAARFFPGQSALGKLIEPGATSNLDRGSTPREIVGIAGDARQSIGAPGPEPIYYFPHKQLPWGAPAFVVRSATSATALESSFRRLVAGMDSEIALHRLRTFEGELARNMAGPRLQVSIVAGVALTALLITATGLYGLLAYTVQRRTREIGVRVALGASRRTIVTMVLRRALLLVSAGVALGAFGGFAAATSLESHFGSAGVPLPVLLALGAALVAVTAASASFVPARRAASVDPTDTLRAE